MAKTKKGSTKSEMPTELADNKKIENVIARIEKEG